jgi:hypothetical protein
MEDNLHGGGLPLQISSITGNKPSIIKYNYMPSPVKPKLGIQLLHLIQPQHLSLIAPELGTAQLQIVFSDII